MPSLAEPLPATPSFVSLPDQGHVLKEQSMNAELQAISEAWQACHGHASRTAAMLGISRTTLWRKMVKYGFIGGKPS